MMKKPYSIRILIFPLLMLVSASVFSAEEHKFEDEIPENVMSIACALAKNDNYIGFHSIVLDVGLMKSFDSSARTPTYYNEILTILCPHPSSHTGINILQQALLHRRTETFEWILGGLGGDYNIMFPKNDYKAILDWLYFLDDPDNPQDYDHMIEKYSALGARRCAEIPECASLE